MEDFRLCAVEYRLFNSPVRVLGDIERHGLIVDWKPDRANDWNERIREGKTLGANEPFLLRRAVEPNSQWYVEDGSGRATAFVQNQSKFASSQVLGVGYLGHKADPNSTFMQEKFPKLLKV